MNDPSQYLVHLTSRGPEVSGADGFVGEFKVFMKQPIKDVNKFGLMMYSVPKTLDTVNPDNNTFYIRLHYEHGDEILVPVRIPMMDYYNCYVSQETDFSTTFGGENQNRFRDKKRCSFDEVLQCQINWAIVKHADQVAPQGRLCDILLPRIGCVVNFNQSNGTYEFTFGYKGSRAIVNPGLPTQRYNGPVINNSGAPGACNATNVGGQQIAAAANGQYSFRRCSGVAVQNQAGGDVVPNQGLRMYKLTGVTFEALPLRLQLMLGLGARSQFFNETLPTGTVVQRGRMLVANYSLAAAGAGAVSGIVVAKMSVPPNLDAPSMLYLQLSVPGTRSKILGQSDERGGWAIPTSANEYVSQYLNLPNLEEFSELQVRKMPALTAANFNVIWAPGNAAGAPAGAGHAGSGYNFDPYPIGAAVGGIDQNNNFALTGPNLSRLVIFGGNDLRKSKAPCVKFPRSEQRPGEGPDRAFGCGPYRASPVFTTSLIQPQFVFTSTENATIQTFDVKLLFGDTSERVHAVTGHPVQFSIIASP